MDIKQRRTDKALVQDRAVQTREKLLEAALTMYMEKGYYKTTVDEIARRAELSTGIAYRYFKNKKELLMASLTFAFDNIGEIAGVSEEDFYGGDIGKILDVFERIHREYQAFHEELEGLRHSDGDVKILYNDFTVKAMDKLYEGLPAKIKDRPHSREKLHMVIGIMENYCHAYIDKVLSDDELKFMREEVIKIANRLMTEN